MKPPRLLAIGRLKPGPEAALFEHYNARLRPPLTVTELPEARGSAAEVRRREGAALLAALPEGALLVAMDLGGQAPTSEALAALAERWEATARPLAFVIGGAEGLDPAVLARLDVELPLRAVFETPRLRDLAARIDRLRDEALAALLEELGGDLSALGEV